MYLGPKQSALQKGTRSTGIPVLSSRSSLRLTISPSVTGPLYQPISLRPPCLPSAKKTCKSVTCQASKSDAAPPSPEFGLPGWFNFWAIWITALLICQPDTIHKLAGQHCYDFQEFAHTHMHVCTHCMVLICLIQHGTYGINP